MSKCITYIYIFVVSFIFVNIILIMSRSIVNLVLVEENLILVAYRYEGEIIEDLFLLDVVIYILK